MKNIIFIASLIVISTTISAQCYIQYTYDTSGNRIKREYLGGCGRPALTDDHASLADTLRPEEAFIRTELVRLDIESEISVYPNPTDGYLSVRLSSPDPHWIYRLSTVSGQIIRQDNIVQDEFLIAMDNLPGAMYIFAILDPAGVVIYRTKIIKP
ncbi:MAG: T9SS type A sorting domain-containing protein [Chitinophagales bacterium]|nr:T9SS type A sorting domain-containing protein [Chitinophagales bacterium]